MTSCGVSLVRVRVRSGCPLIWVAGRASETLLAQVLRPRWSCWLGAPRMSYVRTLRHEVGALGRRTPPWQWEYGRR